MTTRSETEDVDDALDIEKIDEIFTSGDEEQAGETDVENTEDISEDNIENDDSGLNISVIEQNVTVTKAQDVLAVITENPNMTGIFNGDREFLEKALPFFENYNRELRQNGIDKVLCSFNEVEVEKKANQMKLHFTKHDVSPYNGSQYFQDKSYFTHRHFDTDYDSDSDSGDMARYIRLSKKECKIHKRHASKTTTIKSFRMIQRKRDQLHKKYCYLMSDETSKKLYRSVNPYHCSAGSCYPSWVGLKYVHHSVDERRLVHKNHNHQLDRNSSLCSYTSFGEDFFHSNERFCGSKKSLRSSYFSCIHCNAHGHCAVNSCDSQPRRNYFYKYDYQISQHCSEDIRPSKHQFKKDRSKIDKLEIDKSCDKVSYLMNFADEDNSLKICDRAGQVKAIEFVKFDDKRNEKYKPCSMDETEIYSKKESSTLDVKYEEDSNSLSNETKILAKTNSKQKKDSKPKAIGKISPNLQNDLKQNEEEDSLEVELQLAIQASKDSYVKELKKRNIENDNQNVECSKNHDKTDTQKNAKKNLGFDTKVKNTKSMRVKKQRGRKKKRFTPESSESEFEETGENVRHKSKKKLQSNEAVGREACDANILKNTERKQKKNNAGKAEKNIVQNSLPKDNVPSSIDCKTISSTFEQPTAKNSAKQSAKTESKTLKVSSSRLILYTPHNNALIPNCSFVNDKYRLTLEHLGSVIGQKYAEVFFRYYKGKRDFELTSTVYYLPPKRGYYSGDDTSESDIDPLDVPDIGRVIEESI